MSSAKFVVDVMTPNPVLVSPTTPAWSAECLAQRRGVHDLLVVDGYHLVGIVCRCDLARVAADTVVRDCMRRRPVTIDDQDTALEAERIMDRCAVGCLPVLDWVGCLRGVVTRRDLVSSGVIAPSTVRACASCGSSHGLVDRPGASDAIFCRRCLDHSAQPLTDVDGEYFTMGGGD